jgi:thiol-disulfide isomerase/thioredoxin
MMQRTVALLLCACSAAQETATKEPRKVEFEAVVNEEGGRAAFSWTEGEDVTEKATQYCKANTKEELWERCISAVKQQVAASLMEAELPALDLEVQVAEDKTATFSHAEGGDLRLEAHTFCSEYVAEDKVPVCAHHLVQGAVQKAQQLAAAGDDGAAAADASAGAGGASQDAAPAKTAPKQDAAPAKTAPPPQKQTKSAPAKTPSDWARLVGPALVARGGASLSADALEKKKNVAFLFAADWCKPCRDFVPKLVKYYELAKRKGDDKLEILWVSASRSQEAFDAYLKEMPWPAAPFPLAGRLVQAFQQKGHAKGFPTLCFMDTNEVGSVITCDGVQKVMADEYGLTMPYRSPIQNVKRIVKAVAGVVKALLRALGVGAAKTK